MRPTYGHDQESAAAALDELLKTPPGAATSDLTTADELQLLRCRDAALDALAERLAMLGVDHAAVEHQVREGLSLNADTFHHPGGALTWLAASLRAAPRLPIERRESPGDALGTPSEHPVVEAWRTAGSRMLAATHWLRADPSIDWSDAGAGWVMLDDVAVAAEAIAALDHRMHELLTRHCAHDAAGATPNPLGYPLVQRLAFWHGDHHDELDNAATAPVPKPVPGPVAVVSEPAMLTVAHQRLQAYLMLHKSRGTSGELMDRATALAAVKSQYDLAAALDRTLRAAGGKWEPLADIAGEQLQRLGKVHRNVSELRERPGGADIRVAMLNPVILQSRELHRGLHHAGDVTTSLDVHQVYDLLVRTMQVQRLIAERIRRELVGNQGGLDATVGPEGRALSSFKEVRRNEFIKALVDLRDTPPPPRLRGVHSRTAREQLRFHLEGAAPFELLHPSPYGTKTVGPSL